MRKILPALIVLLAVIKGYGQTSVLLSNGTYFENFIGNKPWIVTPFYGSNGTYFADVNGDGKADAITSSDNGVSVRLSNGSMFFDYIGNKPWSAYTLLGKMYFADVNGDGKADAITVNDNGVSVQISDGTKFLFSKPWTTEPYYGTKGTFFADVNGDGKADAIVVNDNGITVRISDGTQFLPNARWTIDAFSGSKGNYFADVNGDGKADAIIVDETGITVRISDGSKFLPGSVWLSGDFTGSRGNYFADVNGDGKADAIVVNEKSIAVSISNGTTFVMPAARWNNSAFFGLIGTYFIDVNGDGKADAIEVNNSPGQAVADLDQDGIDDREESRLLEKYRPFFMFSNDGGDETYLPAGAFWYLTQSELLLSGDQDDGPCVTNQVLANAPGALIFKAENACPTSTLGSTNITINPAWTNYHINPLEKIGNNGNEPGRHGNSLDLVLNSKDSGLYGHVVPVRLTDPYGYDFDKTYNTASPGDIYYKIEYWQLFGYNDTKASFDIGDHEGDWESVQLIYDPKYDIIRSVFHFAHNILFRYDFTSRNTALTSKFSVAEGTIEELRGINYNPQSQDLDLADLDLSTVPPRINLNYPAIDKAQNNTLRLFQDPVTQEFTHPVVYIENGSHESFPTENWSYYGVPNHNGKSFHYLTNTPPNLGEVEFPLQEYNIANVILWYNGYWGAYSRRNDPPSGPILHKNWQWTMSSTSPVLTNVIRGF